MPLVDTGGSGAWSHGLQEGLGWCSCQGTLACPEPVLPGVLPAEAVTQPLLPAGPLGPGRGGCVLARLGNAASCPSVPAVVRSALACLFGERTAGDCPGRGRSFRKGEAGLPGAGEQTEPAAPERSWARGRARPPPGFGGAWPRPRVGLAELAGALGASARVGPATVWSDARDTRGRPVSPRRRQHPWAVSLAHMAALSPASLGPRASLPGCGGGAVSCSDPAGGEGSWGCGTREAPSRTCRGRAVT